MAEKGIHYRTGGKLSHSGCEILPEGKDIEYIVIEKVEFKETEEIAGRKETGVWIATFAPNPYTKLPMVLNSTNRKRLSKLANNEYINLIKNFPVRLCKEACKDAQDGGMTVGLRISKIPATRPTTTKSPVATETVAKPAAPQKKVLDDSNFESAKVFLENNPMEELEKYYSISDEMKQRLNDKEDGQ